MNIQSIKVKTVDTEKLIDFLKIKLNKNEKLSIDTFAVFQDKFMIDVDCCFSQIDSFHNGNIIIAALEIPCRIKTYNAEGKYSIRMDRPDFIKVLNLDEYLKLATEVNLVDFIRLDYNPRITGNQKLLMKYINQ